MVLKNDSAVECLHYNKSIRRLSMCKKIAVLAYLNLPVFSLCFMFVAYLCSQSVHMLGLSHVRHVTPVDVSINVYTSNEIMVIRPITLLPRILR